MDTISKKYTKEVTEKIKNYFFIENKIKILENTVSDLKNQILKINESIKDLNFLGIEKIDIKSPNFQKIPSKSLNSYIENGVISQITEREILINKIDTDIKRYINEIKFLKLKNMQMNRIFNVLDDYYKEILVLRYYKNKSCIEVCNILNISENKFHKDKKKVFTNIYNLMIMYNEI